MPGEPSSSTGSSVIFALPPVSVDGRLGIVLKICSRRILVCCRRAGIVISTFRTTVFSVVEGLCNCEDKEAMLMESDGIDWKEEAIRKGERDQSSSNYPPSRFFPNSSEKIT